MEQVRFTLEVDDLNRNKHDARQNTTSASRASHHSPTREQRALSLLKVREVRRTRMLERAELDTVGATVELNLTPLAPPRHADTHLGLATSSSHSNKRPFRGSGLRARVDRASVRKSERSGWVASERAGGR